MVGLDGIAFCGPGRETPDEDVNVPVSDLRGGDRRLFARLSPGPPAVEDEVHALIRREEGGQRFKLVRRYADRPRNAALPEFVLGPRIHEKEGRIRIYQLLELIRAQRPHRTCGGPGDRGARREKERGNQKKGDVN